MVAILRTLDDHPFLKGMAAPHVARLAACARDVSFAEGAIIFREGGAADALYLLVRGQVALEVHVPGSGPIQVETLHGGDILGLHWLFPPQRWALDARAVGAVTAVALDAACARASMDEDPILGYAVAQRLLRQVYSRLDRVRLQRLDVYRTEP